VSNNPSKPDSPVLRPALALAVLAAVVRCGYLAAGGVIHGGDTRRYLQTARDLSEGTLTVNDYPLQALYSLILAPVYALDLDLETWVLVLHLALGVATVVVMYLLATLFLEPVFAFGVGVVVAVLPTALHWSRYIYSETLFLLILSLFLLACVHQAVQPSTDWRRLGVLALTAFATVITRPSGWLIVWTAALCLVGFTVSDRSGRDAARKAVTRALVASIALAVAILAIPPTREGVLESPTVYTSLWVSTRSFTSEIGHVERGLSLPPDLRDLEPSAQGAEMRARAFDFIRNHPVDFASRGGIRFVNFWFPWITASQWSRAHFAIDVALSLALVVFSIYALVTTRLQAARRVILMLALVALLQGVLVGLSQLDSEARLRLPVELTLLPVAAAGVQNLVARLRAPGVRGRQVGRVPAPPPGRWA
jgi:hypothetical protein